MIFKNLATKKKIVILVGVLLLLGILTVTVLGIYFSSKNKNIPSFSGRDDFDVSKKIETALANLEKANMAEIIAKVNTTENVIVLTFQGLADADTNRRVLDLISKYDRKVNFFVPGVSAVENASFVKELSLRGHRVGSNTLNQAKNMQDYSPKELIDDFVRANSIIQSITKQKPTTLMCNSTIYSEALLKAAFASGNTQVVQATKFLNFQSFKDYEQVVNYLRNLDKGSIVSIKMDGVLEEDEYEKSVEQTKPEAEPAKSAEAAPDKRTLAEKEQTITDIKPAEKLVIMVDWLMQALEELDFKFVFAEDLSSYKNVGFPIEQVKAEPPKLNNNGPVANDVSYKELAELRRVNQGGKAQEYKTIYTTEKALCYSFYGIHNKKVLDGVLMNLDLLEAKGTFFVSKDNVIHEPELVYKIAQKGHEIGICLTESRDKDFYSTLQTLLVVQKSVAQLTGQTPTLVRYPYDLELQDEILEAIACVKGKVIWQDLSVASSQVGINGTVAEIMDTIFGDGNHTARRGYIIYFRMDYYQDPQIIPATLLKIAQDRIYPIAYKDEVLNNDSSYSIKTVGAVLNGEKTYNYPLNDDDILPAVKDRIYPGHLAGYTESDKFSLIKDRYVGNPDVRKPNTLPDFTEQELEEVDKTGRFTQDKVLFLTFDDWATDKAINQLLYVLDKHGVKASFFVRTNYIHNNPNILRAIAEAGHDVASHSDQHLPFAIRGEDIEEDGYTKPMYHSLNDEEIAERRQDLLSSYNKLQYTIGDVSVNGRPALTTLFRPPTLAMSREGMEAIFDMGFSHIVSGDVSMQDYDETDPEVLADRLINGTITEGGREVKVQNGSILILHMSDFKQNPISDPNVTAKALDIAIPVWKSKGYGFARLSDYLR